MHVLFLCFAILLIPKNSLAESERFETERPNKSRTSYTVNANKIMLESEFVNYAENTEEESFTSKVMQTQLRYGTSSRTEAQIKITPIVKERVKEDSRWNTSTGISNTELGFKYNFTGNEGGSFSLAALPFLILPTSSANLQDERTQGGFALPMDFKLPDGWKSALMLEVNTIRDDNVDWQTNYISTLSFNHSIFIDSLQFYFEIYNESGQNSEASNKTTLDFVFQYDVYENVKLDMGTFIGLSPAAEDAEVFAGGSFLF